MLTSEGMKKTQVTRSEIKDHQLCGLVYEWPKREPGQLDGCSGLVKLLQCTRQQQQLIYAPLDNQSATTLVGHNTLNYLGVSVPSK